MNPSQLCLLSYGNGFSVWHYRNNETSVPENWDVPEIFSEGDVITITHTKLRKTTIHSLWMVDGHFQLYPL